MKKLEYTDQHLLSGFPIVKSSIEVCDKNNTPKRFCYTVTTTYLYVDGSKEDVIERISISLLLRQPCLRLRQWKLVPHCASRCDGNDNIGNYIPRNSDNRTDNHCIKSLHEESLLRLEGRRIVHSSHHWQHYHQC